MTTGTASANKVPLIQLALQGFSFPEDLDNDKANFRLVIDVRYVDEERQLATHHAVLPSMDTYWECDKGKDKAPNYVRAGEGDNTPSAQFAMDKIDPWDCLVFLGKARMVHSVQVKVFDVDRVDFWDKLQNALGALMGALFGKLKTAIPSGGEYSLQSAVSGVFGGFVDDISSTVLKRLSNGDKVLFRGSCPGSSDGSPDSMTITGAGTKGNYTIQLHTPSVSEKLSVAVS